MCGSEVDVEDEVFVAFGANEGDAEVADGGGEGVSEGLDGGAEGVHYNEMPERLARDLMERRSLSYPSKPRTIGPVSPTAKDAFPSNPSKSPTNGLPHSPRSIRDSLPSGSCFLQTFLNLLNSRDLYPNPGLSITQTTEPPAYIYPISFKASSLEPYAPSMPVEC